MIRYRIYYTLKEEIVNRDSNTLWVEMVGKNEEEVKKRFKIKYPYDKIWEVTRNDREYILTGILAIAKKDNTQIRIY